MRPTGFRPLFRPAEAGTANFRYGPDGARVSKFTSTTRTLYPTADIEIDATQPVWTTDAQGVDWLVQSAHTRYPHMDIKVVGSQVRSGLQAPNRWRLIAEATAASRYTHSDAPSLPRP
jgi:hypothetical protein